MFHPPFCNHMTAPNVGRKGKHMSDKMIKLSKSDWLRIGHQMGYMNKKAHFFLMPVQKLYYECEGVVEMLGATGGGEGEEFYRTLDNIDKDKEMGPIANKANECSRCLSEFTEMVRQQHGPQSSD